MSVNRGWLLDVILRYVEKASPLSPMKEADSWDRWIPHPSISEFVQSLTQDTQHPWAAFKWPSAELSFLRAMEVAFERLVPGVEFAVRSAKRLP